VRSAIYVNLLTEDNLPYYTQTLLSHSPGDHPLRDWNHQWTMEENRHSMIMRRLGAHLSLYRPRAARGRTSSSDAARRSPQPGSLADLLCYVAFQERATQIAHRNTASRLPKDDKMGRSVLATIAGDETKHYFFYRDLAMAGFAIEPSLMMAAASRQLTHFAMPGTGIPGFTRHAVRIAREGIYGLGQVVSDVVTPVMETWNLEALKGLTPDGERARDQIRTFIDTASANVAKLLDKSSTPRFA
jgi:acyl-[acyl-carrier-protein] desaturase